VSSFAYHPEATQLRIQTDLLGDEEVASNLAVNSDREEEPTTPRQIQVQ
jgi:hypothetical protein